MAILSFTRAKNIKAKSKAIAHGGVPNLWLFPSSSENGVGSWVFRFKDPTTGKPAKMTIGRFPLMSLAEAAEEGRRLNTVVRKGLDPRYCGSDGAELRLSDVVEQYKAMKKATGVWGSPATEVNFDCAIRIFVSNPMWFTPISKITPVQITQCLLPTWTTSPTMATTSLKAISAIFAWAYDMDMVDRDITRKVKRTLGKPKQIKPQDERHFPAMRWQDVPKFVKELHNPKRGISASVTMFIILTACRVSAACLMTKQELDLKEKVWRVAANSLGRKTTISRVIPLSNQAAELLESLYATSSKFVFPTPIRKNDHIKSDSISSFVSRHTAHYASDITGRTPTVHGFRSTFKQWADFHGYDDRLSELQLWHTTGNVVHQAYAREKLVEQRLAMMQDWADYCFSLIK